MVWQMPSVFLQMFSTSCFPQHDVQTKVVHLGKPHPMAEETPANPQTNPPEPQPISPTEPVQVKPEYEIKREWPNVFVNVQKDAPPKNRIGNFLTGLYNFLTAGILVAAIYTLFATNKSVHVAQDALADNRKKDSATRISDSLNTVKQDSIFRVRFKLDSASTAKQIEAMQQNLAETKKEFSLENQPIMQFVMDSVMPTQFEPGKPVIISYQISNLRDIPAKVIGVKTRVGIDVKHPDFDSCKLLLKGLLNKNEPNVNRYVVKGGTVPGHATTPEDLSEFFYNSIFDNRHHLYLESAIKYEDIYTHRLYYSFAILEFIFYKNGSERTLIINNDIVKGN